MIKGKSHIIKFSIQIIAILLVGILMSVCVYLYIQDKNITRYTVTFADANGAVIETKTIKEGYGVMPSKIDADGYVFRGWDSLLNNITSDTETHPYLYKITEPNLFYFDTIYVREGKKFSLDLMLNGEVNISEGSLTLEFDDDVFDYKGFSGKGITEISVIDSGKLLVSFNSKDVFTNKTKLAEIEFYAEEKNVISSEITLTANAEEMLLLSNGEEKIADCATINNKIYFLQEVG